MDYIAELAMESPATLVAIIGILISGQTVVIKWLMARSDRLVDSLTSAVGSFQNFEKMEDEVHGQITGALERIVDTQKQILSRLDKLLEV